MYKQLHRWKVLHYRSFGLHELRSRHLRGRSRGNLLELRGWRLRGRCGRILVFKLRRR